MFKISWIIQAEENSMDDIWKFILKAFYNIQHAL